MASLDNIELELHGTLTRGISALAVEDGVLSVTLTDGTVHSLGSVLPEASETFDETSSAIPTMSAVAEYCTSLLTLDTEDVL